MPSCAKMKTLGETCACGVRFEIENGCTSAIDSPTVSLCTTKACPSLQPGDTGSILWPVDAVGTREWSLVLHTSDGVDHTITVSANTTSMDDSGCACSLERSTARAGMGGFAAVTALFAAVVRRRRKGLS